MQLPRKRRDCHTFTAHGQTFSVLRLDDGDFMLAQSGVERCRFGNAAEIRQDLEHVQQFGKLPPRSKHSFA